ncbi:MAG: PadR family transcriptional regulator [Candidatus Bathyarchaeia archaeon]|jgi:DNA-binding PadR family transcriptional regulator
MFQNISVSEKNFKNIELTGDLLKSRILRAVLDVVILKELSQRVLTVPALIKYMANKYSIFVNPGTLYPVFDRLEKHGYLIHLPNRLNRLYSITELGKIAIAGIQNDDLVFFLFEILGKNGGVDKK